MGAIYQHDLCTAVVEALNAGVDLLLVAYGGAQFYRIFDCASGELDQESFILPCCATARRGWRGLCPSIEVGQRRGAIEIWQATPVLTGLSLPAASCALIPWAEACITSRAKRPSKGGVPWKNPAAPCWPRSGTSMSSRE